MTKTLEAVYENGVFRPLERPEGIAEHGRVMLTVTSDEQPSSLADLAGCISPDDAQEMRAIVEQEFKRVDLREWR
jgi:predicted DNA-binding antitoxin AbrB/MazE fold protein